MELIDLFMDIIVPGILLGILILSFICSYFIDRK
jgi:hypothetical protein